VSARRLVDQVGILSLGNAAALVLQTLLGIFLARYWTREAYGSYLQVTMVVATVSPILFLGIPSSLYYFLPRYADHRRERVLVQSMALLLSLGVLGALGVGLLAGPLAEVLNNPHLAPAIRWYGLALVGMLPAAAAHPLLVGRERFHAATLVVVAQALADTLVTAVAVLAGASLEALAAGLAAAHIVVGGAVCAIALAEVGGPRGVAAAWPVDRALLAEQLRYAVPFATSTHIGTFGRFVDRYIIGAAFAPALFAVYAVGARQVPVFPLLLSSISIVLQQRFTALHREGRTADILPLWQTAMRKQALLVLPLAALLFVLADPFVTGLYSEQYRDSVPVFQIYLGLLVLKIATWPIVLTAVGETRLLLVGSLVSLAASVVVSLALVRPLGLLGPAIGAVAGPVVVAIYYQYRTGRILGVSWRRLVPWWDVLRVASAAAVAALPLVPFSTVGDPVLAVAAGTAYVLLFALIAAAIGVFRLDDVAFLGRWLGLDGARGRRRWGPAQAPTQAPTKRSTSTSGGRTGAP
jgi:O-antigen/teichoic acid export membrane protein